MDPTTSGSADVDSRAGAAMLLFTAVFAALAAVALTLANVLPPDPGPAAAEAVRQFLYPAQDIRPEPTERRIFLFDLVLLPALALAGAVLVRRLPPQRAAAFAGLAIPVAAGGLLILLLDRGAMHFLRSAGTVAWMMAALAVAAACIAASTRVAWLDIGRNRATVATAAALALLACYFTFAWRTLDVRALQPTSRHAIHLDAVLYSVNQAARGRIPLADYTTQYGFFGVLLAPWFRLAGVSVLSLTATLNVLHAVALGAIIAFAIRQFKQLPLAAGACLAVIFFVNAWYALTADPDAYFQYAPVRFLFPAASVLFVAEWLRRPRLSGAVGISLLAGVALVWNLDSGVAIAGSWSLLLAYRAAAHAIARQEWRVHFRLMAIAVALMPVPLVAFAAWIRWRAGAPVDFGIAIESQRMFYGSGFYMLPMPGELHPWMVVAAIYVFGLVLGSMRVVNLVTDTRAWITLHLSLLGLGLFPYYQGRSHDRVLIYVAWPAILIAFLAADWAWSLARSGKLRRAVAAGVAAPILALGVLCGLLLVHDIPGVARVAQRRARGTVETPWLQGGLAMVRDATRGQRDAVILARFQAVYLAESGLASILRGPGHIEIITRAQGEALVRQVELLRPRQIFIGSQFLGVDDANPYRTLVPFLAQQYSVTATTTGGELRLYTLRQPR